MLPLLPAVLLLLFMASSAVHAGILLQHRIPSTPSSSSSLSVSASVVAAAPPDSSWGGGFGESCTEYMLVGSSSDWSISPDPWSLLGRCWKGGNHANESELAWSRLDLNQCLRYEGEEIRWVEEGNFHESCSYCMLTGQQNQTKTLICSCGDSGDIQMVDLDLGIGNSGGTLHCKGRWAYALDDDVVPHIPT